MTNRQIIKPQLDVPVEVKLSSRPEGTEKDGRYGTEYQYFLNDDRAVMWVPREARDQILRCGAQPGDVLQIVKTMRGRATSYSVQIVPDSQDPQGYSQTTSAANGRIGQEPAPPTTNVRQLPALAPRPGAPRQAQAQPARGQLMGAALCASFDALQMVTEHAKERGKELAFNEEDIRCVAVTMYIQAHKDGKR